MPAAEMGTASIFQTAAIGASFAKTSFTKTRLLICKSMPTLFQPVRMSAFPTPPTSVTARPMRAKFHIGAQLKRLQQHFWPV